MSKKIIFYLILNFLFLTIQATSEIVDEISIEGNERIPNETILLFSKVKIGDDIDNNGLNNIIENLYNTNFFENVSSKLKNNTLTISVKENPIIGSIKLNGIKSKSLKEDVFKEFNLKPRSSYNEFDLENDKLKLTNFLKKKSYYYSKIEVFKKFKSDNIVDIIYEVDLGDKSKIKKISFTGNKIFKDNKLKSIIISEEYKFWKIISGKKYLNEEIIAVDKRLLRNFYLNRGYFNIEINSSFAKLIDDESFELIFNVNAKEKVFFNELTLDLPSDFDSINFQPINKLFLSFKGKPYSLNRIDKILKKINEITINEQYASTKATVEENIIKDKINLVFKIMEVDRVFVKKINIFGNNVTNETVIRNQLELDEGDPFNEILLTRSINNLKSLNFFRSVKYNIIQNDTDQTKIINIEIEEKPTGEIMAGAGFGTSGTTTMFGVKENNYLGKGIILDSKAEISTETFKGKISVKNPNYKNSDKSIYTNIEASETDRLGAFGYKTNKTGVSVGTEFEYYDDLEIGLGINSFHERIQTDATASERQKKLKGNYFDNHLQLSFDYDKRNQKFQTTNGFRSFYSLNLPVISETNTLMNTWIATNYFEYLDKNVLKSSFYLKHSNSISGDNIKLSERLYLPSNRLRGFEQGKIGPKDGNDFIGGNYVASFNFSSTIPKLFENSQSTDFKIFLDVANVWGVDYDSSLDNSQEIRSSIGIGLDWFSPAGPMNFSLTEVLTQSSTDITESFRFNLGTTF